MKPKRVDGNRAKFMSRRLRENEYSPALIRKALEHLGVDPDTYYMIGPDYPIPEPSEEERARSVQKNARSRVQLRKHQGCDRHPRSAAWRTPSAETATRIKFERRAT